MSPHRLPPNPDFISPPLCDFPGVVPPIPGGHYFDPVFGSRIQTIARRAFHHYSIQTPVNRDSSVVLVNRCDGPAALLMSSGQAVWTKISVSLGETRWSRIDPDVFYALKGRMVVRGNVRTRVLEDYIDLTQAPYSLTTNPDTGGNSDIAKGDYTAFYELASRRICVIHLPTKRGKCIAIDHPRAVERVPVQTFRPDTGFDLNIAKDFDVETGKLYIVLYANPVFAVYSLDADPATFDFDFRGPETPTDFESASVTNINGNGHCDPGEKCLQLSHNDLGFDSTGRQFIVPSLVYRNCVVTYSVMELSKKHLMATPRAAGGGRYDIPHKIEFCAGNGVWTYADHVGCASDAPYCVISIEYAFPSNGRPAPNGTEPFYSELFVFKDIGQEIRRVGMHRSTMDLRNSGDSYWDQPRPAMSPDGKDVIFTTNFGVTGRRRVMRLETGF